MERIERHASFGGFQEVWQHDSKVLGCSMRLGAYLPPQAADGPCPVLYFLSGLTCTEQNVITKSGVQQHAAEHGLIVIAPDTSPRGEGVADDEAYDLGQGAGFYLNATRQPWSKHYRMYDYVTEELPALVAASFPVRDGPAAIAGHSMGGHGALVCALRNPDRYCSVSALAPICAPSRCPWGEKAFGGYLGPDRSQWAAYDSTELAAGVRDAASRPPILVDQGLADQFLEVQLHPHLLEEACSKSGLRLTLRRHEGYDHGYYGISSFIEEHLRHHAGLLKG